MLNWNWNIWKLGKLTVKHIFAGKQRSKKKHISLVYKGRPWDRNQQEDVCYFFL